MRGGTKGFLSPGFFTLATLITQKDKLMKSVVAVIVLLLGAYLLYLGIPQGMQPPIVSGIAFILIGAVWLLDGRRS